MKIALAVIGSMVLLFGVLLASATWLIVDVRQTEPEQFHITVPVPLPLARMALHFVEDDQTRLECRELAPYQRGVGKMIRLLRDSPDADLMHVSDRQEEVIISKKGDHLHIDVEGRDEEVRVRLPLSRLEELLSYYDGEAFALEDVLEVIEAVPPGELVYVRDPEHEVTLAIP